MYPDDRVLMGVINRKRDVQTLLDAHWYRIPQAKLARGVFAEYLAFYLSGAAAKGREGSGIYYYAERRGVELVYRRDLLPDEPDHPHANEAYYKIQVAEPIARIPPVTNTTKRTLTFIHTTWDRFIRARTISDLYSTADYYVDRIYHALRDASIRPDRYWEQERAQTGYAPQVRILCENGVVIASTEAGEDVDILLNPSEPEDKYLAQIKARIASKGGAVTINIPQSW
jgi:hypothetical protein